MRNAVWKFVLENIGNLQNNVIELAPDAKIVAFGYQTHPTTHETGWFLWAVVDPDQCFAVDRKFLVIGTGVNWAEKDLNHIMTHQHPSGEVWHLLEWRRA